jgi:hypothetical protein
MQVCQSIIRALPDLSKVKISPASFSASFTNGWVRVAATRILKTLQAKISASPSDEEILEISKMIHENTMKPISDDLSDPNEWIQQFNGPNLRWESIAVLFTFPELFAANGRTVENDPEKMWSQLSFKQVVLECIDQCVNLAMYQTGGNLLLLWVCYRRTFLESITLGDAGKVDIESLSIVYKANMEPSQVYTASALTLIACPSHSSSDSTLNNPHRTTSRHSAHS